jgi:hypothetical protein
MMCRETHLTRVNAARVMLAVTLVAVECAMTASHAEPPVANTDGAGKSQHIDSPSQPKQAFEKQWFIFGGLMNYQTRLEESEAQIDAEINGLFGKVIPRWKEPTTFKDWSDDLKLWDAWIGVGRDISPKWNWFVDAGGGAGTIENSERYYPLLIPLTINVDFERTELFAEAGLDWYPWGKPEKSTNVQTGSGFARSLKATRPYLSLAAGYNHQTAIADVRIDAPIIGQIVRIKDEQSYDMLYLNPRVSIETPITKKTSINFTFGYIFFDEHAEEFNSFASGVFLKYRF